MAETKTLQEMFVEEIRDAYDGEKQLSRALPKMAKAATSRDLSDAFSHHLRETEGQIATLETVFELLGEKPKGKHCSGIAGILEEGQAILEEKLEPATLDACLVAAAQRAEHYEIAAYGSLVAWAKTLGRGEIADHLQTILTQEKLADQKLSALAEGGINTAAWSESAAETTAGGGRKLSARS